MQKERRFMTVEFRAEEEEGKRVLSGYAAVYNKLSEDLGGFVEVIRPGAFRKVLESQPSVLALFNHDESLILGATDNNSLALSDDDTGLWFRSQLPDTPTADEVWSLVRGGYLGKCSFAFVVGEEEWGELEGRVLRQIHDVAGLYDVSVVSRPAYVNTSVSARALEKAKEVKESGSEGTDDGSQTVAQELDALKREIEIESMK